MKNTFWIDFSKYKPLKDGKYLVIRYGDIDIAYWSGKWFETKWVLDEDDVPMDINYTEWNVSHWMELPDKPTIIAEPTQIAQKNEFVIHDVSNSVCKCPICGEKMKGIELTHYKCKKCNEYFTN